MMRRRPPLEIGAIERVVHIGRPVEEVVRAFRGDPEDTAPSDVVLIVDEPLQVTWELTRAGLSGSRLSVEFSPQWTGTLVRSRLEPRVGGIRLRLRRRSLERRYADIVETVLERVRADLEDEWSAGDDPEAPPPPPGDIP